jgi:hypothetical protein
MRLEARRLNFYGSPSAASLMYPAAIAHSMDRPEATDTTDDGRRHRMATMAQEPPRAAAPAARRYEYKVIDTGKHVEDQLNELSSLRPRRSS